MRELCACFFLDYKKDQKVGLNEIHITYSYCIKYKGRVHWVSTFAFCFDRGLRMTELTG